MVLEEHPSLLLSMVICRRAWSTNDNNWNNNLVNNDQRINGTFNWRHVIYTARRYRYFQVRTLLYAGLSQLAAMFLVVYC